MSIDSVIFIDDSQPRLYTCKNSLLNSYRVSQSSTLLQRVTMYCTKMSLKHFMLMSSFILYSINQVSALNCYVCASTANGECYKNPKEKYHEMDCSTVEHIPQIAPNMFSKIGTTLQSVISSYTDKKQLANSISECTTIIGELANEKTVLRTCSVKLMNCDVWKLVLQSNNSMVVKSCESCETDLCNSSHHLSVGFLSLIGSLIIILWTRS